MNTHTHTSGLGKEGEHERNCHTELLRKLPEIGLTPLTSIYRLPMAVPPAGFKMVSQSLLLPRELFSIMYHKYPAAFQERILGAPGALENFWKQSAGNPALVGHDLLARNGYQSKAVPVSLHGDGVPVAGVGKVRGHFYEPRMLGVLVRGLVFWRSFGSWRVGLTDDRQLL